MQTKHLLFKHAATELIFNYLTPSTYATKLLWSLQQSAMCKLSHFSQGSSFCRFKDNRSDYYHNDFPCNSTAVCKKSAILWYCALWGVFLFLNSPLHFLKALVIWFLSTDYFREVTCHCTCLYVYVVWKLHLLCTGQPWQVILWHTTTHRCTHHCFRRPWQLFGAQHPRLYTVWMMSASESYNPKTQTIT